MMPCFQPKTAKNTGFLGCKPRLSGFRLAKSVTLSYSYPYQADSRAAKPALGEGTLIMYVTLYGLKNCDSCRKALNEIEADGHQVAMIDVREDGMDPGLLAGLLAKHGDDTLLNRNSTTWRNLTDEEKGKKAYTLITNHPAVMKRPVLVADEGKSYIGWTADIRAELKKG